MHPLWVGAEVWLLTSRNSPKARHLVQNPFVPLAYTGDTDQRSDPT